MSCQGIRQKLSTYRDQELSGEELQQVSDHLSGCPACQHEVEADGALDMLLKNCYTPKPPTGYMETFWPTLAESLEEGGASAGANGGGQASPDLPPGGGPIVFRSSSAMQILKIPEPPKEPQPVVSAGPAAAPQQEQAKASGASALLVGIVCLAVGLGAGYFVFKGQPQRAPDQPTVLAQAPTEPEGQQAQPTEPLDEPAGEGAEEATAAGTEGEPAAAGAAAEGAGTETADTEGQPGEGEGTAEPAASAGDTAARDKHRGGKGKRRHHRSRRAAKPAAGAQHAATAAAPAKPARPAARPAAPAKPAKKKSGGGGDLLDSLIDDAIGKQEAPAKAKDEPAKPKKPAVDPTIPKQLNMNQIRRSMNRIKGLVVSCYDKYQVEGRANTKLVINNDGTVKSAEVKGAFFGTDTGACVVKAVKRAKFPRFRDKSMTIRYPFILQ
jgi:hypothetical protein